MTIPSLAVAGGVTGPQLCGQLVSHEDPGPCLLWAQEGTNPVPLAGDIGNTGRRVGQRRGGILSGGALTAQSRPSPLNGPLSLAIECRIPGPLATGLAVAISGEAGMWRAGLRRGVGAPVLTPEATQADSIGI